MTLRAVKTDPGNQCVSLRARGARCSAPLGRVEQVHRACLVQLPGREADTGQRWVSDQWGRAGAGKPCWPGEPPALPEIPREAASGRSRESGQGGPSLLQKAEGSRGLSREPGETSGHGAAGPKCGRGPRALARKDRELAELSLLTAAHLREDRGDLF